MVTIFNFCYCMIQRLKSSENMICGFYVLKIVLITFEGIDLQYRCPNMHIDSEGIEFKSFQVYSALLSWMKLMVGSVEVADLLAVISVMYTFEILMCAFCLLFIGIDFFVYHLPVFC